MTGLTALDSQYTSVGSSASRNYNTATSDYVEWSR